MKELVEYKLPMVEELTYTGKVKLEEDIDIKNYKVLACKPGACICSGRCY